MKTADLRFTKPLYSITDAATYVGMPRTTLETWARGYVRRTRSGRRVTGAQLLTRIDGRGRVIPFVGLAEAMVLSAFRATGVPLQRIRPALEKLQTEMSLDHALASRNLYTDGAEVIYDYGKRTDDESVAELTVVRSGQRVLADVINEYLRRITYADDGIADTLILPVTQMPLLLVDPERSFGQPLFIKGGARLVDVHNRIAAGESLAQVAEDYGVPPSYVRMALEEVFAEAAA